MPEFTTNGQIVDDSWRVLTLSDHETPEQVRLPVGPLLVPTAVWRARRAELFRRENDHNWPLGVWLDAEERPEAIAGDLDDLAVIAVLFRDRSADQYQRMVACCASAMATPANCVPSAKCDMMRLPQHA